MPVEEGGGSKDVCCVLLAGGCVVGVGDAGGRNWLRSRYRVTGCTSAAAVGWGWGSHDGERKDKARATRPGMCGGWPAYSTRHQIAPVARDASFSTDVLTSPSPTPFPPLYSCGRTLTRNKDRDPRDWWLAASQFFLVYRCMCILFVLTYWWVWRWTDVPPLSCDWNGASVNDCKNGFTRAHQLSPPSPSPEKESALTGDYCVPHSPPSALYVCAYVHVCWDFQQQLIFIKCSMTTKSSWLAYFQ